MSRDPSLRKRNALVIPGGILLFYCSLAILYAEQFRRKSDFCPDGSWVLIDHVCYTVWKILLPLVLIAAALVIAGIVAFRDAPRQPANHLDPGTPSHFVLALLISLVVVPLVILFIQLYRQQALDTTFVLEYYDIPFKHTFLLTLALLAALAVFLPYLFAYVGAEMRRRDMLASLESVPMQPRAAAAEEAFDDSDDSWPDAREDEPRRSGHYTIRARPVDDVEGIGPEYAGRLRQAGVKTTAELVAQDPATLAPQIDVTAKELVTWQQMAELMGVSGIGPQYAEALARSGIVGIDDLKRLDAEAIVAQVTNFLEDHPRVTKAKITAARVQKWKDTAAGMAKA